MVRGEKCVPFTLPTGCSGRSNHNILSKAKTGSRFLSAGSGLISNVPLGQGGYKIPISFRMDFVISRALPPLAQIRGFDVRGEDIVPAVLVDTADEPP